jgi:glycosyltransferase involved in cell wall biosynthesis
MDPKLRVLHVLGELRPSGAECMLKVAGSIFRAHSICTEVLSTGANCVGSYAQALRDTGYEVHHLPFSKSLTFFLRFYALLRERRFDVVHIHSERANFWFGLTANSARVPRVISTVHGTFAFGGWLRLRRMIFRKLQEKLGVVRIAISRSVQEAEWKYFRSKVRVIPNWYDSQRFRPPTIQERIAARSGYGISSETFVLVSVGNCSAVKNHSALIEAIALLPKDIRITYLHVGAEQIDCSERQLAISLGVIDQFHFLGQLVDPLPALFAADAFVMPSLHEGFGNAALEAFAVGLPVILSNVPGLKDFGMQYPGIAYADPTAESLAKSIMELARTDDIVRKRMTQEYGRLSREGFGVNIGVAKYVELYLAS